MNRWLSISISLLVVWGCMDAPEPTTAIPEPMFATAITFPCFIEAGFSDGDFIGSLSLATGETFSGQAVNDPSVGAHGFVDAEWFHDAPGFQLSSFDRALDVTCLQNDTKQATIDGLAVVNGELGYLYTVSVRDRGQSDIVLQTSDGSASASFPSPTTVEIPALIHVLAGIAGPGLVLLIFDDMECFYRANSAADAYEFFRCEDPSLGPGDTLEVTNLTLLVAGPEREATLSANVGGSGPGASDEYALSVWNEATGELVYTVSGNVAEGDIVITRLEP